MSVQSSNRLTFSDSADVLDVSNLDNKNNVANPNMFTNKDLVTVGPLPDGSHQSGPVPSVVESKTSYLSNNAYCPDALLYDKAHNHGSILPHFNAEGLEYGFNGISNETGPLGFHSFGYDPQMQPRLYSSVSSHLPSVGDPSNFSNARHFSTSDPSYNQPSIPLNIPQGPPKGQFSYPEFHVKIDQQVDRTRVGPSSNFLPQSRSYSGGSNFFGSSGRLCSSYQGFDGLGLGGFCTDWSKPFAGKRSFHVSSPAASPKRADPVEFASSDREMAAFQKGPFDGFSSCGSQSRGYSGSRSDQNSGHGSISTFSLGISGLNWPTFDEGRRGSCNGFSCCCTVTVDTLSERNRGPRAFKPKSQITTQSSIVDNFKNGTTNGIAHGSYNPQNFVTDYQGGAKFFVIKSYSEDNVHKSIKYGVWASTPTGNKKLDTAYYEAKSKQRASPVFLFFSVNASAQFCGVAEMVGPVDFDKSVDYWLQDKWSGQFPVKWHIIKDVPNCQFRHILLKSNDNKPVTNSRDTQEVEMEQGIEMLDIFKNYQSHSSILDDFCFYEERQKAMQERKARQLSSLVASRNDLVGKSQNLVPLTNDFVKKMSKSFAEALLFDENEKAGGATGKVLSTGL